MLGRLKWKGRGFPYAFVAMVISEMKFITFFLPVCSLRTRGNAIYHRFVSLSLAYIRFINYLILKKAGVLRKLSILCSQIMNILKSSD